MRALYLHVDKLWYKTVKPALRSPPDPPGEASIDEALAVFVTIEKGDNEIVVEEAVNDLKEHLERIKAEKVIIYPYAHLSSNLASPREAHQLLQLFEKKVKDLGVEVHRAPFGWYKEFELKCKGHPLAELSRSFTGSHGESWSEWITRWGKEEREAFERLGFRSVKGLHALASLAAYLSENASLTASGSASVDDAYKECLSRGAAGPGDQWLLVLKHRGDLEELLAGISSHLPGKIGREGESILYKPRGVRIAAGSGCIGPIMGVVLAAIHAELDAAKQGATPLLPIWLTPLQAVVIPVSEELVDYAGKVSSILVSAGLRTEIWRGKGLGRRIREAGRRWVPLVAVIGDREAETETVTLRRRWEPGKQETVTLKELAEEASKLAAGDPARRATVFTT